MIIYPFGTARQFPILPKTGQTTSYRTGDDGDIEAGFGGTQFVDNGNGTITDVCTRLMWVKQYELMIPGATGVHATNQIQANKGVWTTSTAYVAADMVSEITFTGDSYVCIVAHTSRSSGTLADDIAAHPTYWRKTIWNMQNDNWMGQQWGRCWESDWNTVLDSIESLQYAGYADWHMANLNQALTMFDASVDSNASTVSQTYSSVFPNIAPDGYWTSTTCKPLYSTADSAYIIHFGGTVDNNAIPLYPADKTLSYLPLIVRTI